MYLHQEGEEEEEEEEEEDDGEEIEQEHEGKKVVVSWVGLGLACGGLGPERGWVQTRKWSPQGQGAGAGAGAGVGLVLLWAPGL